MAPNQIIINGPKATLGSEFNTVRYGSIILDSLLKYHRIVDIIIPKIVEIIKLINISNVVIPICGSNWFDKNKEDIERNATKLAKEIFKAQEEFEYYGDDYKDDWE